VDTEALYSTVRKSGNLPSGLLDACLDFGLPVDEVARDEYCAGNEIHYLWDLFIKMADGATIDQMYRTQFKVGSHYEGIETDTRLCRTNMLLFMLEMMTRRKRRRKRRRRDLNPVQLPDPKPGLLHETHTKIFLITSLMTLTEALPPKSTCIILTRTFSAVS